MAVHEHESSPRPGWFERILVLGVCAGMLIGLAILDDRAAERETARALQVIAERTERAQRAAGHSSREAMTAPAAPRREPAPPSAPATPVAAAATGRDDPLLLMLMAALGLSMAGGGLRLLSRRSA